MRQFALLLLLMFPAIGVAGIVEAGGGSDDPATPPGDDSTDDQAGVKGDPPDDEPPAGDPPTELADLERHHTDAYEGFDPSIHATDANGVPIKTKRGEYAKKRGRKAGSGNAADSVLRAPGSGPAPSNSSAPLSDAPKPINPIVFKHAGRAAAQLTVGTSAMLFGPAWYLDERKDTERDEYHAMASAYAAYFQANGIADIPPGYMLALVLAAYAAPRVSDPETLTRFQKMALGAKNLWTRIRSFRKG